MWRFFKWLLSFWQEPALPVLAVALAKIHSELVGAEYSVMDCCWKMPDGTIITDCDLKKQRR